jgi:hydroxymethylglutaryl-CoA reductase (NADPH)
MAISTKSTHRAIKDILDNEDAEKLLNQIKPELPTTKPLSDPVPLIREWTKKAQTDRLNFIQKQSNENFPYLSGRQIFDDPEKLKGNIENYLGMTHVPTGLIGPLRINGTQAKGDFYVPMATTEGALIASYHRGAKVVSEAGGVTSICLIEAIQRAPSFIFNNFPEAGSFIIWIMKNIKVFTSLIPKCTSHGNLDEVKTNIDGNQVTLIFEFTTGDASGQNMVTICTDMICKYIVEHCPIKPRYWFVEGNLSGDKKATAISFNYVRGKKVTAEVIIPAELIINYLNSTPQKMMDYWKISITNGIQSGSIGVNGHFANGLTAIFLACGQDVACIAEASVGTTRIDLTENGDVYICVTLPNLIVGTVGGGTSLSTQNECLKIVDCVGTGKARKFAEICAATVLCGEISIIGALTANEFTQAHSKLGR